jgi:hypothetical protein
MIFSPRKNKKKKELKESRQQFCPIFGQPWTTQNQIALDNVMNQFVTFITIHGLNLEGIFRLCGVKTRIEHLKSLIDHDPVNFKFDHESTDVHEVTGVLKLFLREMPNPLFTYELYDSFIAATTTELETERPVVIKKCIEMLPPLNRQILHKLCVLLNKIMKNSATNKMTANNLATCICPNVMKPPTDDITIIINDAAQQCMLMSYIITDVQNFFQNGPWVGTKIRRSVTDTTNTSTHTKVHSQTQVITISHLDTETPAENLCATLSLRYREKQEPERGKLQGLFALAMNEPIKESDEIEAIEPVRNESIVETTILTPDDDNLKRDFRKRIEFFEQMLKDGGLDLSPEHGAVIRALKKGALRLPSPQQQPTVCSPTKPVMKKKKSFSRTASMDRVRKITLAAHPKSKEQIKTDEKLQGELQKLVRRKTARGLPEKKKKN